MIALAEQANRNIDAGVSTMTASDAAAASPESVALSQSPADGSHATANGLHPPARQPSHVLDLPQPSWSARSLAAWLFRYLPVSVPPKSAAPSKSSASASATTADDARRLSWFAAPSVAATLEMQRDYMYAHCLGCHG
jgi:hypothetical protein